jgi:hypothetical protein
MRRRTTPKRPLGRVWRRRPRRPAEFVYGVMNLSDDEVGIHAVTLTAHEFDDVLLVVFARLAHGIVCLAGKLH